MPFDPPDLSQSPHSVINFRDLELFRANTPRFPNAATSILKAEGSAWHDGNSAIQRAGSDNYLDYPGLVLVKNATKVAELGA